MESRSFLDLSEQEMLQMRSAVEGMVPQLLKEFHILHGSTSSYNLYRALGRAVEEEWRKAKAPAGDWLDSPSLNEVPACLGCGLEFPDLEP